MKKYSRKTGTAYRFPPHPRIHHKLARNSDTPRGNVAHALLHAVSRLVSTSSPASTIVSSPGVAKSADAARRSARAVPRGSNVRERCGLVLDAKRADRLRFSGVLAVLLVALFVAAVPAHAQRGGRGGPPPTPQADAPFDLTGYWVSVITQNWRLRMVVPARGDYIGIPLNEASKKIADAWDPAKDEASGNQCKGYNAAMIMTQPERLHLTWQDPNTLRMDIDAGTQTREFHFGNWKPPGGPATWQGDSVATWSSRRQLEDPSGPKARSLKVVTTNMRPGYLRRNGVPYSATAKLTEYFDVYREPNGESWMIATTVVDDPVYLDNPLILNAQFKKQADAAGWDPTPCSTKW